MTVISKSACSGRSQYSKKMVEISAYGVSKSYGRTKALDNICFETEKGEIFGIIGPDGAGKTTLFRIMTTLMLADSGTVTVAGYDVIKDFSEIRRIIGYMPGRFSLYKDLSVEENLSFFASVFGTTVKENYHLVADIYKQLEPFRKRRADALSGGMKQKLALCCAMIHKPRVLFLDEPTTGVDPVSRKEFWAMLSRLKSQGVTIIVSTPYMDEAGMCDRIALIMNGRFLKIESPSNMLEQYDRTLFSVRSDNNASLLRQLRKMPDIKDCYPFGETLHVVADKGFDISSLPSRLVSSSPIKIESIRPTIEDCFMELNEK